jgi:hypothetical protein
VRRLESCAKARRAPRRAGQVKLEVDTGAARQDRGGAAVSKAYGDKVIVRDFTTTICAATRSA